MSYINKITKEYDDELISLDQLDELKDEYKSLSRAGQWELDGKPETAVYESRLYELKGSEVGNLNSINANLKTIKNILLFFLILSILSILIMLIPILNS
jgi:hypothetical protein